MIHAVIGIWANQGKTYYVKRSQNLTNYKGTWSLPSIRCSSDHQVLDLPAAQRLFNRMSEERWDGISVVVKRFLTSGSCNKNPMDQRVVLHLYQIEPSRTPILNAYWYTDAKWMYLNQYKEVSKDLPCGLCTRLWTDYAVRHKMARNQLTWDSIQPYQQLIEDKSRDSYYLRRFGLKPNIKAMLPDKCKFALDVGSGTGWFAKETGIVTVECDVAPRQNTDGRFCVGQITELPYADNLFPLVIASMVLCWENRLDQAVSELARVAAQGGTLIVALPHPMFYQTGTVCDDNSYRITQNYNSSWSTSDLYIGEKVGPLSYYHRPLHRYINAFFKVGYRLTQMREWSIDQEHYLKKMQGKARKRTTLLPLFVFLRMEKQ